MDILKIEYKKDKTLLLTDKEKELFKKEFSNIYLFSYLSDILKPMTPNHKLREFILKEVALQTTLDKWTYNPYIDLFKNEKEKKTLEYIIEKDARSKHVIYTKENYFYTIFSLIFLILLRLNLNWKLKELEFISKKFLSPKEEKELIINYYDDVFSESGLYVEVKKTVFAETENFWNKTYDEIMFLIEWKMSNSQVPIEIAYLIKNN